MNAYPSSDPNADPFANTNAGLTADINAELKTGEPEDNKTGRIRKRFESKVFDIPKNHPKRKIHSVSLAK